MNAKVWREVAEGIAAVAVAVAYAHASGIPLVGTVTLLMFGTIAGLCAAAGIAAYWRER